jgi:hypothetical protein
LSAWSYFITFSITNNPRLRSSQFKNPVFQQPEFVPRTPQTVNNIDPTPWLRPLEANEVEVKRLLRGRLELATKL